MLLSILILPLLGFLSGSLFGRLLGKGVTFVSTLLTFSSFLISFSLLLDVIETGNVYILTVSKWILVENIDISWSFCFDSLTVIMLFIVTFISSLVHLYSTEYMEHDPHLMRFMSYLSLFTFFMLILVTANNFIQMFVGWEGVGVSSYLLINFWFTRIQANKSAIKAMLVNRVGDFFILLALFLIFFTFSSLDYDVVFSTSVLAANNFHIFGFFEIPVVDLICLCLFLGAMGKSAQLGLHTWLPDAMEGPTPVSALIHAATMVTAGVFLISRCSFLFEQSPVVLNVIMIIGSCTSFFAATTGLFQNDMKKVIAYSTCSQLGYMIFACGLSSYQVGIFHLSNHAFFKALLFLGAGSVIHALSDEQDMRRMGGLRRVLPFSYAVTLIGSLALMGIPFLSGFYSKDVILELSYASFSLFGHFSFFLGVLAASATAFYSIRLIFLVFLCEPNGLKNIIFNSHEGSWKMSFPLFVLIIFSLLSGFVTKDLFIGFGTDFWGSSIFVLPSNYLMVDIEFISLKYKLLPLIFTLLGAGASFYIYGTKTLEYFLLKKTQYFKYIYTFFNKKWFFDRLYNENLSQGLLGLSLRLSYQDLDRGLIEYLGPFSIVTQLKKGSNHISSYQTGYVVHYLIYILVSVVIFLICCYVNVNLGFICILILFFLNFK